MNRAVRVATLALAIFGSGCSEAPADDEVVGSAASAIVGGALDDGDPAVVALSADGDAVSCSGTVIAPRAVLTAAHCLVGAPPAFIAIGSSRVEVAHVESHPAFHVSSFDHDIALVFLTTDAPVMPTPLGPLPEPGQLVRLVGYGREAPRDVGAVATKRHGIVRVESVDELAFRTRPAPAAACTRDSGGAVLDAQNRLAGVISRGDEDCDSYSVATRVDRHRDFIDGALRTAPEPSGCVVARGHCAPAPLHALLLLALLSIGRRNRT